MQRWVSTALEIVVELAWRQRSHEVEPQPHPDATITAGHDQSVKKMARQNSCSIVPIARKSRCS